MREPSMPWVNVSTLLFALLALLLLQQDEAFVWGGLRPSITAPTAASISLAEARRLTTQVRATPEQVRLPDLSQTAFPEKLDDEPYDLIVLGSGPAGETAGCKAAQLGQKVAIVEIKKAFGGPTGLTSKAVREAAKRILKTVDQVGGDRMKQIKRLWGKRFPALKSEAEVYQAAETRERLMKNDCDLYIGSALLVNDTWDPDNKDIVTVRVCRPTGCVELQSRYVVIATGSRPSRPKELRPGVPIPYTSRLVIDATQMANLKELPESLAVIGGGVISVEYATVFAALGLPTFLLCRKEAFLPFLPKELQGAIKADMARNGIQIIHNPVSRFEVGDDRMVRFEFENLTSTGGEGLEEEKDILVEEDDGGRKQIEVGLVLYSGGRDANSEKIGCENVGVEVGKYGRIIVDKDFRTANPRVFAIGDVIGPPGLASFAQQSARVVTDLLFREEKEREEERKREKERGEGDGLGVLMGQGEVTLEDWAGGDDFFAEMGGNDEEEEEKEREKSLALLKRMEAPLTLWTVPEIASSGVSTEEVLARGEKYASEGGVGGGLCMGMRTLRTWHGGG
ncbi:soluble pyridine nucleotide transhydrogenase [Nannochloropsis oceanica]